MENFKVGEIVKFKKVGKSASCGLKEKEGKITVIMGISKHIKNAYYILGEDHLFKGDCFEKLR